MTRRELRHLLGEPTCTSFKTRRQRFPLIWKYGDIEYHFDSDKIDGKVWLIYTEDEKGKPTVIDKV